ncbi:MAG: 3-isopropylmalate dehydratase|nr:3-isopropylmalate dehydratase [Candidatus Lokiarchaeota archaeon]MBD3202062.1 3-isopropylmalate dehydratase [Candidatus Lokiarchaeota archaeon]
MAFIGTEVIKEYKDVIKGEVWVFPDNVDTDVISPGKYLDNLEETLNHTCEGIIKDFPKKVKDGDLIVAGKNFGCGSSRETAAMILQAKGIVAIVAESFARIFFRSAFARALPILEIENVSSKFENGDIIKINIPEAKVENLSKKISIKGEKIHPSLLNLLKEGGLENKLIKEVKNK